MHALEVAANGFRAKWHRAVDQCTDPCGTSALDIETEARRNFNRRLDISALETADEVRLVGNRRLLDEIGGASEFLEISAALGSPILIQHREGKIVDVRRDPETEYQHE